MLVISIKIDTMCDSVIIAKRVEIVFNVTETFIMLDLKVGVDDNN